jgi:DNA invertase Pin-like site-specific DNA recombinase
MLTILAGVATWEREIMLERQREGIAKAKAAGKYKGRPVDRAKCVCDKQVSTVIWQRWRHTGRPMAWVG